MIPLPSSHNKKTKYILCFLFVLSLIITLLPSALSICDCNQTKQKTVDTPNTKSLSSEDIQALQQQGIEQGWTFQISENEATKRPLNELCGFKPLENWRDTATSQPMKTTVELPAAFNWKRLGLSTYVKNQGPCGSCWAFATVAPLEDNIFLKDNKLIDLSEQYLVSCNSDDWGCDGGWWAFDYLLDKPDSCGDIGAVREHQFPYTARDDPCNCPYNHSYTINSWSFVSTGDDVAPVNDIKQAIMQYGPVAVAVCVDSAFAAYNGDVFNADNSGEVNHAVALYGWDDSKGANGAWLLKNSWGTSWGIGGWMWIEYGCSSIGYAAVYIDYGTEDLSFPTFEFTYPQGKPTVLEPNVQNHFLVDIEPGTATPVENTGWLSYSTSIDEPFTAIYLNWLGGNHYEGVFSTYNPGTTVYWYVSAQPTTGRRIADPIYAPCIYYTSTVSSGLIGDLNHDGQVTLTDLAILLSHYGTTAGAKWDQGDLDNDGDVDISDLATLIAHYGGII